MLNLHGPPHEANWRLDREVPKSEELGRTACLMGSGAREQKGPAHREGGRALSDPICVASAGTAGVADQRVPYLGRGMHS